jgi:hypothetical protein
VSGSFTVPRFTINVVDRERSVGQVHEFGPFEADPGETVEIEFPWHEDDGSVTQITYSYEPQLGVFTTPADVESLEIREWKPA